MTEWLLRNLGISDEFVSHLQDVRLGFQHPALLIIGLALVVPVTLWVHGRQKRSLTSIPWLLRWVLTATRVLIFVLLVLVLGSPFLKLDHQSEKKPIVAVLLDHSQSMQLPAGPFANDAELSRFAVAAGYRSADAGMDSQTRLAMSRLSRSKLTHAVITAGARAFFESLASRFDVQYYSFARDLTRLGIDPARPDLPEPPNPAGTSTWIGDAVGHVVEEAGDRQVAGILVFSDGQNNGGRSLSEVAALAAARAMPVFSIPAGSTQPLQDVAITDVFTSGEVHVGDTARVAVTVQSHGFDGRPVKVQLKDGEEVLDTKEVILRAAQEQQVDLSFKAAHAGAKYLTVSVPAQPEEPEYLRGNNADTAFVRVSNEKVKVLLIDGLPRWDFRFLRNALRRDHGIGGRLGNEADVRLEAQWRHQSPEERAAALPRSLDQLAQYQAIVVGDVSPDMLDGAFLRLLDQAVRERGVGLIVAAGPLAMPHRYGSTLQDLLPVRMRSQAVRGKVTAGPYFRLELSPEGCIHEATRFYDDPGRNQDAWANMPRYYWYADAERAAPGATVLLWNPLTTAYGKIPLVAHHYAGKGRVLFVGTDETFRWRQNVGDRFFYKFWGQAVRFVARRDAKSDRTNRLEVHPPRAQPGEQAQVELMAFAPDGAPRTEPVQTLQVQGGSSVSGVELSADGSIPGRYTGKLTPSEAGEYRLIWTAGSEPVEARLQVSVAPEELRHPNVNRAALQTLASASGGVCVEANEVASIADRLQGESRFTQMHREVSLWDNGLTLSLLIFLYCLDVGIRRLVGLS